MRTGSRALLLTALGVAGLACGRSHGPRTPLDGEAGEATGDAVAPAPDAAASRDAAMEDAADAAMEDAGEFAECGPDCRPFRPRPWLALTEEDCAMRPLSAATTTNELHGALCEIAFACGGYMPRSQYMVRIDRQGCGSDLLTNIYTDDQTVEDVTGCLKGELEALRFELPPSCVCCEVPDW